MKTLGRIILLVVGGLMIASAIKDLVNSINYIQSAWGWQGFLQKLISSSTRGEALPYLTALIKASIMIIVSASAIFAGIKGKGGFWFTIFSIIILSMFVWDVIEKNKQGFFQGQDKWGHIIQLIIDSGTQIGYILGFVFLKIGNK